MTMIIDGRKIAEEVLGKLKNKISLKGLKLRLAVVLVGDDPEFKKFVELKDKAAEKAGIDFEIFQFSADIDEGRLITEIEKICVEFDGVLIELPLPANLDQQKILNVIPVEKDVDVLSDKAQRLFYDNKDDPCNYKGHPCCLPPAVEVLRIVLEKHSIVVAGKKAAIFGYGNLIGKPIAYWLGKQGAEVSIIRSKTENPAEISRKADIIISGVGKPGLITGDMVKEGAVVIDFGYGKKDGKMKGDVNFESVSPKTSLITPVPGGMGPILIAAVLSNLVKLKSKK